MQANSLLSAAKAVGPSNKDRGITVSIGSSQGRHGGMCDRLEEQRQSLATKFDTTKLFLVVALTLAVGSYHLGRLTPVKDQLEKGGGKGGSKSSGGGGIGGFFSGGDVSKGRGSGSFQHLTPPKIEAIRNEALSVLDMLDEYYSVYDGGGAADLLGGSKGWARGWDWEAADSARNSSTEGTFSRREDKLVDTMMRALADETQDTFIIGVIGSSVAAGHDNCKYDNYESQLQRTYGKVWEAAGMKLDIQNAGEGGGCGDSHRNQVWCVKQNVSPFSDIVHYSWSYFEAGGDEGKSARESLIRWTQMLPKQPPVNVLQVGDQCYTDHREDVLFDTYSPYGYDAMCMRWAMTNSQHNQSRSNLDELFAGQHSGDGYHATTRYGEKEPNRKRRESLGVILRNWHPGPLGFQFVADAFAYVYTTAVLHALDRIEQEITAKGGNPKKVSLGPRPILLKYDLPDPIECEARYCQVDEAPTCRNYEAPTYGWYGAKIADPDDKLNPYRGEEQSWEPYSVPQEVGMINKFERRFYKSATGFCAFDDQCRAIASQGPENGRVVFQLPKMEVGMVAICGCCGKQVATPQFLENEFIEIELNGEILKRESWDLYPEEKCVRLVKENAATSSSTGHAYLSVRLLRAGEGDNQEQTPVRISHVITI